MQIQSSTGFRPLPRTSSFSAPAAVSPDQTTVPVADSLDIAKKDQLISSMLAPETREVSAVRDQLVADLRAIPSQTWRILQQGNLTIIALPEGKNLSETSVVEKFRPADYGARLEQGRDWLRATVRGQEEGLSDDEFQRAMWESQKGRILAEALTQSPQAEELGFQVARLNGPVDAEALFQAGGSDAASQEQWWQDFQTLNGEQARREDGQLIADDKVVLLPYPYREGVPLKPNTLNYLQHQNDAELQASMGANYWQSALVAIHPKYAPDPAPEAGHHRVLIHEVGHAIDHVLERIENGGFGDHHRRTVDAMFEQDRQLEAQGVRRFSSPRAKDNAREYFAEAVEAYLTQNRGDQLESKPNNHKAWLQANNPELYVYVDSLFHQTFPDQLKLAPLPDNPDYPRAPGLLAHFEKGYLEL